MKITRTQKDAVISLLKERYDEKQKVSDKQFITENEKSIRKEAEEYQRFLTRLDAIISDLNQLDADFTKFKEDAQLLNKNKLSFGVLTNYGQLNKGQKRYTAIKSNFDDDDKLFGYVSTPHIERPDFAKISRQLELDTLSKDFDLDAFLKKYLD